MLCSLEEGNEPTEKINKEFTKKKTNNNFIINFN